METWSIIPYKEQYEVSTNGTVRKYGNKIIKPFKYKRTGYMGITLFVNKKREKWLVHRLVATTFLGQIPLAKDVNHKNGIKTDNNINNLEIVTRSENQLHAFKILKRRRGHVKLTESDVLKIRASVDHNRIIAKQYNISRSEVYRIKARIVWKTI